MAATAKKRKKKYNPTKRKSKAQMLETSLRVFDKAFANERQRVLDEKELAIRQAAMGATLSFNSSWDDDSEFFPTKCVDLMNILGSDHVAACGVLVTWHFDWVVTLTVYCEDDYGKLYDQPVVQKYEMLPMYTPEGQTELIGVEDLIEGQLLDVAKSHCNPRHIKEWGYVATITFFD